METFLASLVLHPGLAHQARPSCLHSYRAVKLRSVLIPFPLATHDLLPTPSGSVPTIVEREEAPVIGCVCSVDSRIQAQIFSWREVSWIWCLSGVRTLSPESRKSSRASFLLLPHSDTLYPPVALALAPGSLSLHTGCSSLFYESLCWLVNNHLSEARLGVPVLLKT